MCGSDIFINAPSDILSAKQGLGAKKARIICRRSLVLCKASPQNMCTLEQWGLEEQLGFTKNLFIFLICKEIMHDTLACAAVHDGKILEHSITHSKC